MSTATENTQPQSAPELSAAELRRLRLERAFWAGIANASRPQHRPWLKKKARR